MSSRAAVASSFRAFPPYSVLQTFNVTETTSNDMLESGHVQVYMLQTSGYNR